MQTLGPKLETFTAGVTKKYGFDGGFHEAMQSIAAVGGEEKDEKIRCATQPLSLPLPAAVTQPLQERFRAENTSTAEPKRAPCPVKPVLQIHQQPGP